jgi:hypothetical protein
VAAEFIIDLVTHLYRAHEPAFALTEYRARISRKRASLTNARLGQSTIEDEADSRQGRQGWVLDIEPGND